MTINERVHSIAKNRLEQQPAVDMANPDKPASIEKMILLAYEIGREEATKEVSNAYANLLHKIRERADQCRYHHMVRRIISEIPSTSIILTMQAEWLKEFGGDLADV